MSDELANAMASETPAWMAEAACRGTDPDMFFVERWGSVVDASRAKAVCNGCAVREECLAYALALPEIHGIWGGLSPVERRAERRRRNVPGSRRVHPESCGCPTCAYKNRWKTA